MTQYRFWQIYSDPTPYETPTRGNIVADRLQDAVELFCRQHRLTLAELDRDKVWVEDENGKAMEYSVSWDR